MLADGADREEKMDAMEKLPCFRFTAADRELIPEEPVYDYFDEYYDGAFSGVIGENGEMTVVTPDGEYGYISGDGTITIINPDGQEEEYTHIIVDGEENEEGIIVDGDKFVIIG